MRWKSPRLSPFSNQGTKIMLTTTVPHLYYHPCQHCLKSYYTEDLPDFSMITQLLWIISLAFYKILRQTKQFSPLLLKFFRNTTLVYDFMCRFSWYKKAFDIVNHWILTKKLWYYGIRGVTLDLFTNYLTNRCQFVYSTNHTSSEKGTILCGVPQISILRPLSFSPYIYDVAASQRTQSYLLTILVYCVAYTYICFRLDQSSNQS